MLSHFTAILCFRSSVRLGRSARQYMRISQTVGLAPTHTNLSRDQTTWYGTERVERELSVSRSSCSAMITTRHSGCRHSTHSLFKALHSTAKMLSLRSCTFVRTSCATVMGQVGPPSDTARPAYK